MLRIKVGIVMDGATCQVSRSKTHPVEQLRLMVGAAGVGVKQVTIMRVVEEALMVGGMTRLVEAMGVVPGRLGVVVLVLGATVVLIGKGSATVTAIAVEMGLLVVVVVE